MYVSCKGCVLSARGLCDGPIHRPEESYRLWCVNISDLGTSETEAAPARVRLSRQRNKIPIKIKLFAV